MRGKQLRGYIIKSVLLLAAGLALGLAVRRNVPAAGWVMVADVLFAQATVFLLWGVMHLLGNIHMFTSFTWSFKTFHKLLKGKQDKAQKMKDDYLAYRDSRPHHGDVPFALIGGAVLLVLSAVCSLLAG